MKFKILSACLVFTFGVAVTSAQTKSTSSGKCAKAGVQQSVPAGDKDGHTFMIQSGKCETMGKVGDANSTEGAFAEHDEATGNIVKGSGVFVETYDTGDKIFYAYQATVTMKDGSLMAGVNKYQITGGTGKMKGIKGSGTCKMTAGADSGFTYKCTGDYTLPEAAPAK
jgi:hypothetical protein